jgi:hypothetical protein
MLITTADNMKKSVFFSLFFLFFAFNIVAQTTIEGRLLGMDDGLPSNRVFDVYQDNKGVIWIATDNGICRYVGNRIEKFYAPNAHVGASEIYTIIQDHRQNFIIGSTKGFDVFDVDFTENKILEDSLNSRIEYSAEGIQHLLKYNDEIWALTNRKMLVFSDGIEYIFKRTMVMAGTSFEKDNTNKIWVCGNSTIQVLENDKFELKIKQYFYPNIPFLLPFFDDKLLFISGKTSFLISENVQNIDPKNALADDIKALESQMYSKLGLNPKKTFHENGIRIYGCLRDNYNNVWISTNRGLFVFSKKQRFVKNLAQIPPNSQRLIYEDKQNHKIIFSTYQGASILDKKSNKINPLANWEHVRDYIDYDQNTIIGIGESNVFRIYDKQKSVVHYSERNNFFFSGIAKKDNLILLGTELGICEVNFENTLEHPSIKKLKGFKDDFNQIDKYFLTLYEDPNHPIVWAGGNGVLCKIDLVKKEVLPFIEINNIKTYNILSFFTDAKDNLWIGTKNYGLLVVDKTSGQIIKRFTTDNGLSHNTINAFLPYNDDEIIFSTDNSISKININSHEIINLGKSEGITQFEFNACAALLSSDNIYYFGGVNGINYFHKNEVVKFGKALKPKLIIDKIIKNNIEPINLENKEIVFYSDDKSIEIYLSSSDLSNPLNNNYAYQIVGLDNQWVNNLSNSVIRIYNLPPKTYKILLKTTNGSNNWSEIIALNLVVKPIFYKTWWFIITIFCSVICAIAAIFWYRNNEISNLNRLKKGIADDLHDDLAGTMNTISMIAKSLTEQVPENTTHRFNQHLGYIHTLSEEAYSKIGDIIWSIGGKVHPIDELYDRVLDYVDTYRVYENCKFIINTSMDNDKILLSAKTNHNILMIVKEAVHNAFKHTKPLVLRLSIVQQKNYMTITIINEYEEVVVGLPSSFKGKDSMERRAQEIKSNLVFDQKPGNFSVILSLQR